MSDARGFMIAAYVLTILTLCVYGVRLGVRARDTRRRLVALRTGAARACAERDGCPKQAGSARTGGGHHVPA